MSKKKSPRPASNLPTVLDQARDELFSHILRCGVLEAAPEHQKEWMDDTMQYLADRYPDLKSEQLEQVRVLGERFCQPVVKRTTNAEDSASEATEATEPAEAEATEAAGATA